MSVELKERFSNLSIIKENQVDASGTPVKTTYRFTGPFQEMNDVRKTKNKNGRIYTKALWEKVFADEDVQGRLKSKRMLGELDHPVDEGQIRRTSHIVTELFPDYDSGLVTGKLELLNHDQGDAALLKALVEQGVQLCVSSRGFGDFLKDGCTIDPESFKLITFDIVLDPSVPIATLNRVAESVNRKIDDPAGKARQGFTEVTIKETKNKNLEESEMEQDLIKALNENRDLAVKSAKTEGQLESMKELVTAKNERLVVVESENKQLNEKVTALSPLTEKVKQLEATVKEYEAIEEKAIKMIEGLKAKVSEYEKLGEKAADTIDNLLKKMKESKGKKNEGEEGGDKTDADKEKEKKEAEDKAAADKEKEKKEGADPTDAMGTVKKDDKEGKEENADDDEDDITPEQKAEHRKTVSANLFESIIRDGKPKK